MWIVQGGVYFLGFAWLEWAVMCCMCGGNFVCVIMLGVDGVCLAGFRFVGLWGHVAWEGVWCGHVCFVGKHGGLRGVCM